MARDAKQLGTLVALPSKARKPLAPAADDRRCDRDRLDVGDRARATEQADVGRKGRLETRLALLAFDRLDQRRLLAADVRACPSVEVDVERVARPAGVLAKESGGVGFVDRLLDVRGFVVELSSDVDVGWQ